MKIHDKKRLGIRNVYLVLDTSESMHEVDIQTGQAPIQILRSLVEELFVQISQDSEVRNLNRFSIITFNTTASLVMDAQKIRPGTAPPRLETAGYTHFSAALHLVTETIKKDFDKANSRGWRFSTPSVFLITDGKPEGESDTERNDAWQSLSTMDKPMRPSFFTFPIPPFDGLAIREMEIYPGVFFDNLATLGKTGALNTAINVIRFVTTQSTGGEVKYRSANDWVQLSDENAEASYLGVLAKADADASRDNVDKETDVAERCPNCQAERDWNDYITGLTPGYRWIVRSRGAIGAARYLMSEPMRDGILRVDWDKTLEANVLEYRYRCLWTNSDRQIARSRLLSIGISQKQITDFEDDQTRRLSKECVCEFCPSATRNDAE